MYRRNINFLMISKALSESVKALRREKQPSVSGLKKLKEAQEELQLALSFSLGEKF